MSGWAVQWTIDLPNSNERGPRVGKQADRSIGLCLKLAPQGRLGTPALAADILANLEGTQMLRIREGSALAGAGAIAFGVLTIVGLTGGAPGGNYVESDVANYVSIGHFPTVIVTGYLALFGVVGLICLLAYLREAISVEPGRKFAVSIFWGIGLAAAASMAVSWGLITGIAVAAAEGGSAASVSHPATYVLSDTSVNVLFGSGGILLGFALIALMLGSRGQLPNWLRWLTLIVGVLATGAPFYFPAFAIPIWGVVIGVWLIAAGRVSHHRVAAQPTA